MLWPGMRFSLRTQCKRCSAGRLHISESKQSSNLHDLWLDNHNYFDEGKNHYT